MSVSDINTITRLSIVCGYFTGLVAAMVLAIGVAAGYAIGPSLVVGVAISGLMTAVYSRYATL